MDLKVNVTCEMGAVATLTNEMLAETEIYSMSIEKIGFPSQLLHRKL